MTIKLSNIIYSSIIALGLFGIFMFPRWTVDDAYIYYRYADNWAVSGQPLWNIGEKPVEGFTGIGLLLILFTGIKMGMSPITVGHFVSVASYLASLYLIIVLGKLLYKNFGRYVLPVLFLLTTILFTHAWSGLETMLFLLLFLLSLYFLHRSLVVPHSKIYKVTLSIVCFLASLTRPEGIVLTGAVFLTVLIFNVKNRKILFEYMCYCAIFYLLPFGLYWLARFNYFEALFPNTFYVKGLKSFSTVNFLELMRFVYNFYRPTIIFISILLIVVFKLIKNRGIIQKFKNDSIWPILCASAMFSLVLILQYSRAHLTMNYAYRFYIPIIPLFWFGIAFIIDSFSDEFPIRGVRGKIMGLLLILLISWQLQVSITKYIEEYKFARNEEIMLQETHVKVGQYIKEIIPSNEKLVVYMDAGAIPFYSGLSTIDYGGLNNVDLARIIKSPGDRVEYFFANNPGVSVFTSVKNDVFSYTPESERIINDPLFIKNYSLVKKYFWSEKNVPYNQFLYIRNDLIKNGL